MGLSTPSGKDRGSGGSEILSNMPKVTQQEAGLLSPPGSCSQTARKTPVLSSIHPLQHHQSPFHVAAAFGNRGFLGNVERVLYASQNSQENSVITANENMGK